MLSQSRRCWGISLRPCREAEEGSALQQPAKLLPLVKKALQVISVGVV